MATTKHLVSISKTKKMFFLKRDATQNVSSCICLSTNKIRYIRYFCSEITKRYDRKQKVQKWEHFINYKLSCNDAAYGKLLKLPLRPKRDHIKQCENAHAEVGMEKAEITKELEQVHTSYNNLSDSSGLIPRKWATEQISYESSIKEVLSNMIARLDSGIQQIKITEQSLKDLFPHMASNTGTTRSRRIKEGQRKAKHGKGERLNGAALVLLQAMTILLIFVFQRNINHLAYHSIMLPQSK